MAIDKGMFNFQGIMDEFYGWKPGADDDAGRAQKNSFMANMVQSGFDANVAKDMAMTQAGLSKEQMTHAADLDLRNKTALMNEEYNKGMMSMGGQFEFQDRFAEDQNVRDITKDTTQIGTQFEFGERANENQNIRDINKGSLERADNFEYANQGAENQNVRDIQKQTANLGAQFDYTDKLESNQAIRDMAKLGYQNELAKDNMAATGTQRRLDTITQGEQNRLGTMQEGDENRKTQDNATTNTIRSQNNAADNTMLIGDAAAENTKGIDSNKGMEERMSQSNLANENRNTIDFTDQIAGRAENRQSARSRAMARSF